jgi:hypothetical protein
VEKGGEEVEEKRERKKGKGTRTKV